MMVKEKGFTVVELVVVVLVIGILATIVIPKFNTFRAKAMDTSALSDMKQMMMSQDQYKMDVGTYAHFTEADKQGSSVNVTINGYVFSTNSLSPDVEMKCVTSGDGLTLIIAAKHIGSSTVVATDLNKSGTMYKLENQVSLADATIPESTHGDDLTAWSRY